MRFRGNIGNNRRLASLTWYAAIEPRYVVSLDVSQVKQDFADLMVTLENLTEEEPEETNDAEKADVLTIKVVPTWCKIVGASLAVAPVVGMVATATIGLGKAHRR